MKVADRSCVCTASAPGCLEKVKDEKERQAHREKEIHSTAKTLFPAGGWAELKVGSDAPSESVHGGTLSRGTVGGKQACGFALINHQNVYDMFASFLRRAAVKRLPSVATFSTRAAQALPNRAIGLGIAACTAGMVAAYSLKHSTLAAEMQRYSVLSWYAAPLQTNL